jgi:sulfur carrier protein ThiS
VHIVLVNGYHVPPSAYHTTALEGRDIVAIWLQP